MLYSEPEAPKQPLGPMLRNSIILVTGRKGSGKSTWVRGIIPRIRTSVVILDPLSEYGSFGTIMPAAAFEDRLECDDSPHTAIIQDGQDGLEAVLDLAYTLTPHTLIIEEAHRFCSPYYLSESLSRIVREGRHRRISIVLVTQGVGDIHSRIVSQCDGMVCFVQRGPSDLRKIEGLVGRENADKVSHLPCYECLTFRF